MSERNKHIDDLFNDALGDYTETPPPAVWDALEQRLDDDANPTGGAAGSGGGRPVFPYRWLWFIGALLLLVAAGVTVWSVTKKKDPNSGNNIQNTNNKAPNVNTKYQSSDENTPNTNNNDEPKGLDSDVDNQVDNSSNNNSSTNNNAQDSDSKDQNTGAKKQNTNNKAQGLNNKTQSSNNKAQNTNNKAQTTKNNTIAKAESTTTSQTTTPKVAADKKAVDAPKAQQKTTDKNDSKATEKVDKKTTVPKVAADKKAVDAPKTQQKTIDKNDSKATEKVDKKTTAPKVAADKKAVDAPKTQQKTTDKNDSKATEKVDKKTTAPKVAADKKAVDAPKTQQKTIDKNDSKATEKVDKKTTAPKVAADKKAVDAPKTQQKTTDKNDSKATEKVDKKTTAPKVAADKKAVDAPTIPTPQAKQKTTKNNTTTVTENVDEKTAAPKTDDSKTANRDYLKMDIDESSDSSALDPFYNGGDLTPDGSYKSWNKKNKHKKQKPKVDATASGSKFGLGFNVGYEYGFDNNFKADKIVIAPYVQYNASSRISLLFQPAYLMGFVKAGDLSSGNELYYNQVSASVDSMSTIFLNDSMVMPQPPYLDTIVTTYTYKRTYDSTVVSRQFSQKQLWAAELPLMLQYKISENFSVFGGVSVTFSKVLRVEEQRMDYTGITDSLQTINSQTYPRNTTPPRPPVAQDPNTVFGSYTGKPIGSYQPMVPSSTATMFTRFGYNFGFNATVRERFILGLSLQQKFANSTQIPNESLRKIYTQPYIRMTIGYKIFK